MFTRTPDPAAVTVVAALRNRLGPEAHVTHMPGPDVSKVFPGMFDMFMGHKPVPPPTAAEIADWEAKSKAAADSADVIIAVVGEPASMSGESASRSS